jgi:hypothetical protein
MPGLTGLRPGVDFEEVMGGNTYHDFSILMNRRYSQGLHTAVMYTYAYSETQDYYHNEFDSEPSWRVSDQHRPHRFVWTAIYELPFGRGKRWAQAGVPNYLFGGWQLSSHYQFQSGPPTNWGNYFFYGDPDNIEDVFKHSESRERDIHLWFDPSIAYRGSGPLPEGFTGFEGRAAAQPGAFHTRVFPTRLSSLRADGFRGWDLRIQRRLQFTERVNARLALDVMNATNRTNFAPPHTDPRNLDFGRVTQQAGIGRNLQFGARIEF